MRAFIFKDEINKAAIFFSRSSHEEKKSRERVRNSIIECTGRLLEI